MRAVRALYRVATGVQAYNPQVADEALRLASLVSAAAARITPGLRRQVNAELERHGLDGNRPFRKIGEALNRIGDALGKFGLEWDTVLSADLFMGPQGRRTLDIALTNPTDSFSPTSVSNSLVVVSWYQRESGNFEVTAYLS